MEIKLTKLDSGVLIEVFEDGECVERACGTGRWNIYPVLSKHLFAESSKKLKKKPEPKPKSKRKL